MNCIYRGVIIEIIVLAVLAIIIAVLLAVFFSLGKKNSFSYALPEAEHDNTEVLIPCPLCATMLKRGERVHSVVYPGENDRLVEIYGCPYCYPQNSSVSRICPVCKKLLAPGDIVYARMFTSASKKPHIHVNGCSSCMKRR